MLRNYINIAIRNLLKNKLFSLINISGMAISIACFLLITLFVYDEYRYDKHVYDHESKFRIYNDYYNDNGARKMAMVPPMIAPTLAEEYPEVEYYTRFMNFNNPVLFEAGEKKMTEGNGGYADPTVFDMFSLNLTEGDSRTALTEPNTVAISQTLKQKYFGEKPALGEIISIFNQDFRVTAVFQDFSKHSHLQLNYFLPMVTLSNAIPERMKSWMWSQFHTYIKLKPNVDASQLETKLRDFAERNAWEASKKLGGTYYIPHLMPLADVHLNSSDLQYEIAVRGNAQTVYILMATAIFILVIAILNFVNLSTARAVNRVKEVGVRKVVGAYRTQLIHQFISESVIIAFIALLIGGLLTELALPSLNNFTQKNIPTGVFLDPLVLMALVLFVFILGVAAGSYPAFYVSAFKPAQILSGKQGSRSGKTLLRKGLVVVQFSLSCFLIIASLVASDQHSYMRSKDMGFSKENLIAVQLRGEMQSNAELTKQVFSNHPNIISSTLGYGLPGEAYAGDGIIDLATKKDLPTSLLTVDHDYVRTLGLTIIAGRDFSKESPSDTSSAFIVSEAGARMLGYSNPADALGHEIGWNRWDVQSGAVKGDTLKRGEVIGVVRDFHLNSLRDAISPVVIQIFPFGYTTLTLKVKSEGLPETIRHLEASWKKFEAEWPFEYRFVDDNFDKLYQGEEKLATLFLLFTGFTIFVASLGMFGLVVYSTTQKYKEISIRKILGAAESSLVIKLSKTYILLILIAFMIAMPFSYYVASEWLQNFAYRISLAPALFVKAGLLIITIALVTVAVQSYKAARSNPVNALKEQ